MRTDNFRYEKTAILWRDMYNLYKKQKYLMRSVILTRDVSLPAVRKKPKRRKPLRCHEMADSLCVGPIVPSPRLLAHMSMDCYLKI